MPHFISSGPRGRQLAASSGDIEGLSSTKVLDAASEALGDAGGGREDLIILDSDNSDIEEVQGGPFEYVDKELLGGVNKEDAKTTDTTKPALRKTSRPRLDSLQWLALTGAVLSTLGAIAWQLTDRLPQLAKPAPVPTGVPSYDPNTVKWQLVQLRIETLRLEEKWKQAPDAVKEAFLKKYIPSADAAKPLDVILRPARCVLEWGLPAEQEPPLLFQQLKFLNAAVLAAQYRLKNLSDFEDIKQQCGLHPDPEHWAALPDDEALKEQKEDLVSLPAFSSLLLRQPIEAVGKSGIPRPVAERLAQIIIYTDAEAAAAANVYGAFGELLDSLMAEEEEINDIELPDGGRPVPLNLLKSVLLGCAEARHAHSFPKDALAACTEQWKTETALKSLKAMEDYEKALKEALQGSKDEVLKEYFASYYGTPEIDDLFTIAVAML